MAEQAEAPPPPDDDRVVETVPDHETGARARIVVEALPRKARNRIKFLRHLYQTRREDVT